MIKIAQPTISNSNGKCRLSAEIDLDGITSTLWLEVEERFGVYLCSERSDAFVIGLLHYAMKYGHDIESKIPMTERIYEQLTTQFLPIYYEVNKFTDIPEKVGKGIGYRTKIITPVGPEVIHPDEGVVGTGCSCGVDSLHVFAQHPEIEYACIWNLHGAVREKTDSVRDLGWQNMVRHAGNFANYTKKTLLVADTNFDRGALPDLKIDSATTYGNLFCIFALQKLWKRYYVASGCDTCRDGLRKGVDDDTDDYEVYLFPFLSPGKFVIVSDGGMMSRLEKVRHLADYEPAYYFLNVCWGIQSDNRNCTAFCPKCMRTITELDCINALDRFARVFDVEYYYSHIEEFLAEYLRNLIRGSIFSRELKTLISEKHYPKQIWFKAYIIVIRKIVRKLLRGGAVSNDFRPN